MKYKTKPIDYTGCDPVIAEHLKRGEHRIYCVVSGSDRETTKLRPPMKAEAIVYTYWGGDTYPYKTDIGDYKDATPIPQKTTYVKKASEIVKWLEDEGWEVDCSGDFYNCDESVWFYARMLSFCGKPAGEYDNDEWLPDWLEER